MNVVCLQVKKEQSMESEKIPNNNIYIRVNDVIFAKRVHGVLSSKGDYRYWKRRGSPCFFFSNRLVRK